MRIVFFAILLFFTKIPFAQQPYTLDRIPDSLKQDVNAVYFLNEIYYKIESSSSLQIKEHKIVTILNREGKQHGVVQVLVDKLMKLEEAEVIVFDATGKQVEKYKKRDFKLYGAHDGISLATDNQVYDLDYPVPGYPHTVEISYTLNLSGYIDIPPFFFGSSDASFLNSQFIIETSTSNDIQYKTYNFDQKPVVTKNNSGTVYRWKLSNLKKPYSETSCYGSEVTTPWVDVAPLTFKYDGYAGSLKNWKEFGSMFYPFYEEKEPFSSERKAFFQSIAAKGNTQKEKIELLYHYLQKETRYVSIQFGIGGYKPFPVSFTEEKKYGDCKGLTHYMKNILQAAGIKSYAALINAGSNRYPVDPAFAGNRFNHVILCVPGEKDTIWLECTSKQTRTGRLSNFTENRYALLLTEDGGKLVRTPDSRADDNIWQNYTMVDLYEDGSAILKSKLFVTGEFKEVVYTYMLNKTKDDLKKVLVGYFAYKNPDDLELKVTGDSAGGYILELALAYSKYYDFKAGSKHFFPVYASQFTDEDMKPSERRKFDYVFDYPYSKTEQTIIRLPASFTKESIPPPKTIKNQFLDYKNEISFDESTRTISMHTQLTIGKHIIPAPAYNDVAVAMEYIKKADNHKIILKKD